MIPVIPGSRAASQILTDFPITVGCISLFWVSLLILLLILISSPFSVRIRSKIKIKINHWGGNSGMISGVTGSAAGVSSGAVAAAASFFPVCFSTINCARSRINGSTSQVLTR